MPNQTQPAGTQAKHPPPGGTFTRHFRALMRKNWIYWSRTPCGSILEIFCPVLLMLLMVWARSEIDSTFLGAFDLYMLKKPIYPVTTL